MAAIVAGDGFDFEAFAEHLSQRLPAYAIPLFLRLSHTLDATETFKQKKHELVRDGFDPARVTDPLFLRDESGCYRPLDAQVYARIADGSIRL
jgi:fatty-acyl-CoA synthase